MKNFWISFKIVDHDADDAGHTMPTELTIVIAQSKAEAIAEFCADMVGEHYEIVQVFEH